MLPPPDNADEGFSRRRVWYLTAFGVAYVSGAFCLLMAALIIVNYFNLKRLDPVNSPGLMELRERHQRDPGNAAIREEIRTLDYVARKAFFVSQSQIRAGGYLLIGGAIVFTVCLQVMAEIGRPLPDPRGCPGLDNVWLHTVRGRRTVAIGGAALFTAALGLGFLSHSELGSGPAGGAGGGPAGGTNVIGVTGPVPVPAEQPPARETIRGNWPNFRGPEGNGVAYAVEVPLAWNGETGDGILWRTEMPRGGYSSPVVWSNRVFVTGGDAEAREVYCYDAGDGSQRWRRQVRDVPGAPAETVEVDENTGWAAPSPATDGRRVFAVFATGELVCHDLDGNPLWSRSVGPIDNHYAHSSSLIVHEHLLIVQVDDAAEPRVLGLDARTGADAWKAARSAISWASPICVDTGRRFELILTDSQGVAGYDPRTGARYWREDCLGGEVGPSAAYADGMIFTANDNARATGLKLAGDGVEIAWEWNELLPDAASPLATSQHVFLATSVGPIVCLGAKTGEPLWEQEFDGGFYASPILVGDLVYALARDGVMHVFKAAAEFESVAKSPLGEQADASPAVLDRRVYIRGRERLFCIGSK